MVTSQRIQQLKEKVALLPDSPGVYQFLGDDGKVIYVGKAKNLKRRVSSYFLARADHSPKVRVMVGKIADLRHTVVATESEALLLENNMIKSIQPRYNILLKDDKTYPWIVIRNEPFPRVLSTGVSCATVPSISVLMLRSISRKRFWKSCAGSISCVPAR